MNELIRDMVGYMRIIIGIIISLLLQLYDNNEPAHAKLPELL